MADNSFLRKHQGLVDSKGRHIVQCNRHGSGPGAKDVCPKCLHALWVDREHLKKLHDKDPDFIKALVARNNELYQALVKISEMEREYAMPTYAGTQAEKGYEKVILMAKHVVKNMKPMEKA